MKLLKPYLDAPLYEGHPKALIEVMALGMAVLGAKSPGIEEEIQNGVTGLLVPPTSKGLRSGLESMIKLGAESRSRLGNAARLWASKNYPLEVVVSKELEVFTMVTHKHNREIES